MELLVEKQIEAEAEVGITPMVFYVLDDLAAMLGVSARTVRDHYPCPVRFDLEDRGKIRLRLGRSRLYTQETVTEHMEALNPDQDVSEWWHQPLLDSEAAAEYLTERGHKMTAAALRKHRSRGTGPAGLKVAPGTVRYTRDSLDTFRLGESKEPSAEWLMYPGSNGA